MTWTNLTYAVGQVLTAAQMTNLQANILAAMAGDSGAPRLVNAGVNASAAIATSKLASDNGISQSMLAPNSVGQSEVKTASQNWSGTGTTVMTGGAYCIGLRLNGSGGGGSSVSADWVSTGAANFSRRMSSDFSSIGGVQHYINSSPPYNLGDGLVHQFVYALVNNATGELEAISISPDPCWIYNGPTRVIPFRRTKTGKIFRRLKDMSSYPMTFKEASVIGGSAIRDYMQAFIDAPYIFEEITMALKNADMDIVPHPFIDNDLTGKTPILLDPVSPIMLRLMSMTYHEDINVLDVIQNYLVVGNTPLTRKGPAGLLIPSVKWRLTP